MTADDPRSPTDVAGRARGEDSTGLAPLQPWRALFENAVLAGACVALARTAPFALKDGHLAGGRTGFALRSAARHVFEDGTLATLTALALAWSTRRPGHALRLLAGAGALGLGYLYLSFRLPFRPFYAPTFEGARALLAQGAALGAALSAVLLALGAWPSGRSRRAATAAALALLALAGSERARHPLRSTRSTERPDLVLVSLDTLRADHLGCYGYREETSPELDRFAATALRFTRAFTPQPWTLTAHMSMLTGLYPSVHDVEKDRGLPSDVPTLAELLQLEGYATVAVVDRVVFLHPRFGFDRGFDLYRQLPDSAAVKRDFLHELLADRPLARPLFLFLHFYDAHSDRRELPYEAATSDVAALVGSTGPAHDWCDAQGRCASAYLRALLDARETLDGAALDELVALYDAGIRTLDRELGALFAQLEVAGILTEGVTLVTSDHGEELFEHGRPLHSQCYDECVSIPFLLRAPGVPPGVSEELVSLVDVVPTLLAFAGADAPPCQGVSLADLASGRGGFEPRDVVLLEDQSGTLGLRAAEWSLVPRGKRVHLFDHGRDPGQAEDLLGAQGPHLPDYRPVLARESARLEQARARIERDERRATSTLGAEDELRALGYGGD